MLFRSHGVGGAGLVVDEFVDHHAGIGGQREHRVVGEENAEVRADPGRNDIALKYRVAFIEIAAGAVGSLHAGNAVQKADLAYRRPEGGVASLCQPRSEEHTSELQSLLRKPNADCGLKKTN